jgi:LuxR family maltose regulon positive regulatory protein
MNYITLARVFLVQGEFERASELLERLHKIVNEAGAKGYEIEILILQALTMQGQGRAEQVLERLERALIIAESQGYLRMFIEEGAPMARLLETAISSGIAPDYASKLLAAFKDERPEPTASSEGLLVEPLSQRELEILALVAAGWSNRQIAEELYLAVGTVKKHLNNIFGKLQVERRTQAVARAKELGLL